MTRFDDQRGLRGWEARLQINLGPRPDIARAFAPRARGLHAWDDQRSQRRCNLLRTDPPEIPPVALLDRLCYRPLGRFTIGIYARQLAASGGALDACRPAATNGTRAIIPPLQRHRVARPAADGCRFGNHSLHSDIRSAADHLFGYHLGRVPSAQRTSLTPTTSFDLDYWQPLGAGNHGPGKWRVKSLPGCSLSFCPPSPDLCYSSFHGGCSEIT